MRPIVFIPALTTLLLLAVVACVVFEAPRMTTLSLAIVATMSSVLTLPHILDILHEVGVLRIEVAAEQGQVRACLRAIHHTNMAMMEMARKVGLKSPAPPHVPLTYAGKPVFPERDPS